MIKRSGHSLQFSAGTALAILFCINFCPAGATTEPADAEKSAKSKEICVAILAEPDTATEETAKAGKNVFVTELAKAFEKHEGFRVLDRDHIAKVLREQSLSASGLVRQPLKAGRLFGAQYLIYSTSEKVLDRRVVSIICVEVSSGNVVFEKAIAVEQNATVGKLTASASQVAKEIQGHISKSTAAVKLPSAAILYVENKSPSKRLDFLEHQLRSLMESTLKAGGYRVLRRRYAGRLAKETLLSTAGLVRPDATVLAEAADLAISVSFTESPSPDKAFKDTPITMVLKINRKGHKQKLCKLTFTLAGLKKLLPQLQESFFNSEYQPVESKAQQRLRREIEAAELLATLTPIPFMAPIDKHRRQVKLAERVIYLDPTAKEAYFLLGFSLDACIRRSTLPWWRKETFPMGREAVDAYEKYLSFPRTNRKRTQQAFRKWVTYWCLLNQDKPKKTMAKMAEWVRWQHSVDPKHSPCVHKPSWGFGKWWEDHHAERAAFYTWVDELYKWDVSCFPLELADAYYKLGKYSKTARYLCEVVLLAKRHHRPGLLRNVRFNYKEWKLAQVLKHATPEQAKILKKHFGPKPPSKSILIAMYGQAYGKAEDLYEYSRHTDDILLKKFDCQTLVPQPVLPPADIIQQNVIMRLTKAGLWVQGVTDQQKLVIYFSPAIGQWKRIKIPVEMEAPLGLVYMSRAGTKRLVVHETQNRVISIVQAGDEVLFATPGNGIYIYHLRRKTWRHIGMKEGLSTNRVSGMVSDKDGKGIWIYGGKFLCRYKDGKIYAWKNKIPLFPLGMYDGKKQMYLFVSFNNRNKLVAVSNSQPKAKIVLSERQQRQLLSVPTFFYGTGSIGTAVTNRRLVGRNGKMYLANKYGFVCLTEDAKPIRQWYPSAFCYWKELGGWVEGNCPLPPCSVVMAVVPDDSDPNRLWVLSSAFFITAYDTEKNIFSKPIRIKGYIVHIQPRGEYMYMTGKCFSRLPKKEWVLDQPGQPKDTPLRVQCPDTIYGRASEALFHKDFDKVRKLLQEAIDAGIAVNQAKKMLKGIDKLQHPKKKKKTKRTKKTP